MLSFALLACAQYGEDQYVHVTDKRIAEKLGVWQDLKFGLFMHWGPNSIWGVTESWTICNEDWIFRDKGRFENYEHYKEDYRSLYRQFNPVQFNPDKWAKAAKDAGMRYVIFTTKHHDGFCMFDTHTTDYKITSQECPFSTHPRANVTKEIFDAFRKDNFFIGAYFSKPDWNCPDYWWPYYATPDRHVNYNPARHPKRWQRFKDFVFRQIEELMTNYGQIDILWLDGAWVRPLHGYIPEEHREWAIKKDWNQDIDMPRIVRIARKHQPDLIVVDRWISGEFENYLTPEQKIPDHAMTVPWESCITMTSGWSYNEHHNYKSVRELIHMLVDIVCKGGNLLLNIGPSPQGDWGEEAYDRLRGIGEWMKLNNEAIYGTRPIFPYKDKHVCLTRKKDGTVYAIYLADLAESHPPSRICMSTFQPNSDARLLMLGTDTVLNWEKIGDGFIVHIPESLQRNPPCSHAWVIRMTGGHL